VIFLPISTPKKAAKITNVQAALWSAKFEGDHNARIYMVLEDPVRAAE